MDLPTVSNKEYDTVSTTLVHHITGEQEMYSLCTRVFVESYKEADIMEFVPEVRDCPLETFTDFVLTRLE